MASPTPDSQPLLARAIAYLQQHAPYYGPLLAGTDPSAFDAARLAALPCTTKEQLQERPDDFLCVPHQRIAEYTATSGSLGRPLTVPLTAADQERLARNECQSFRIAGCTPADTFQLALTLDRQFMAGMAYYRGIGRLGARLVRTGPGLPAMQWETMLRLRTTVLVAVPSFIHALLDYADAHGLDPAALPVQRIVCIGEPLSDEAGNPNVLAQRIGARWDVPLLGTYAATELQTAYTECAPGSGMHEQPDLIHTELLDEEGRPVADGEYGEVTVTTLGVEALPLLRYRTGDIARWLPGPCPCGRPTRRLSAIRGRKRQMLKYRGTTVFPASIIDLLQSAPGVEAFQIEAWTGTLGTDELRLHVAVSGSEPECLQRLKPLLTAGLRVCPEIVFHPREALERMLHPEGARKQLRFADRRC